MKKNILTIIVMAVSIVNLVLGIVLVFSIVPASNKTAALVDKVASVIDLNIDDPNSEEQDYTIDDLVAYTKTYDSAVNINLKKDAGDDSNHYAQLAGFTISFNSKKVSESIQTNDIYVDDIVKETLGSYTATTLDLVKVRSEIVKKIQAKYNTKAVVEISLKDPLIA